MTLEDFAKRVFCGPGCPRAVTDALEGVPLHGGSYVSPWDAGSGREKVAALRALDADHAIRRALGEDPKPGTRATLTLMHGTVWRLDSREHGGVMIEWSAYPGDGGSVLGMARAPGSTECPPGYRNVPELEGLTDPDEALRAIYRRLTDGAPFWPSWHSSEVERQLAQPEAPRIDPVFIPPGHPWALLCADAYKMAEPLKLETATETWWCRSRPCDGGWHLEAITSPKAPATPPPERPR